MAVEPRPRLFYFESDKSGERCWWRTRNLKAECLAQQKIIEVSKRTSQLQRDLDRARQLTARATADAVEAQQARASLQPLCQSCRNLPGPMSVFAHAEAKATERVHAEAPIAEEMNRLTLVDLDRAGKRWKNWRSGERFVAPSESARWDKLFGVHGSTAR